MFQDAFLKVKERVEKALSRSARKDSVRILPVTKTVPAAKMREAYEAGERYFGESRVQELLAKKPELPPDIHWHFIGHLQTNKVKKVVGEVELIHSVDSVHLAEALSQEAKNKSCEVPLLLEVNVSAEASKSGFQPETFEEVLDEIQRLPHLVFRGLMTIGPLTEDESKIRQSFAWLREIRDRTASRFNPKIFQELSMGMSHDFEIAIEEGATIIRIGTLLFGERRE